MKTICLFGTFLAFAAPVAAQPVDMTGLACTLPTKFGPLTWEFYGDIAVRYYSDGSVSRLPRVGEGAYEKYNSDGSWASVVLFFDTGDGIQMRILGRPGLLTREQNPTAPMEKAVFPFNASCSRLWEQQ